MAPPARSGWDTVVSMTMVPTEQELAHAISYVMSEFRIVGGRVTDEQWAEGLAFGQRTAVDADDKFQAKHAIGQLSAAEWRRIAARAIELRRAG